MATNYELYRYYKGEKDNPFNDKDQNSGMFWFYESVFERKYTDGTLNEKMLKIGKDDTTKELKFKKWLDWMLSDQIPSKWGIDYNTASKMYYKK